MSITMDSEEHHRLSEKEATTTTTTTSPSHEFSFTISLHPSPNSNPTSIKYSKNNPTFAIDLAPADDIFFHGHLLPLHLLSSTSISPRPSDFSIENLNLPLDSTDGNQSQKYETYNNNNMLINEANETKEKFKPKNFSSSLFGFGKWLPKAGGGGEKHESGKTKKKKMLDLSRVFKRYVNAIELLFTFRSDKEKQRLPPRPYSFSGNISVKDKEAWRKRRGELSAPASMRTSPTNSGLLVATSSVFSSSDESTMEELQNAIQAAISHCKNSIAVSEEKCIC
ncbi:BRI1 kinase inhibitor 1 protein [Dioscorea alata]|uniref:BRI1 kinase inhibitor 1 protein n=1 Tax=Dioscorea alata TaxID=55571 RepID=A0ACB7VY49_DIOAL|nr:BRI1 kinase inhibitor 1 protein [Dioscorea alata]